jgi:Zn-dependent protease with chaperone function
MATIGDLNFRSYIEAKKSKTATDGHNREDAHAYAYISDRTTRSAFEKGKAIEYAVSHAVRFLRTVGKNELVGNTVKVGPNQFPRVHNLAKHCAETLGIEVPTMHITNNPTMNAMTFGTNDDAFILIHSGLIDHFSDEELLSVIGHECGHIHNDHVVYLTTLHYLHLLSRRWLGGVLLSWPAVYALRAWSRRAEITCDRAGMLCSKSLDVSSRALAKLALGSSKLYDEMNMEAFLDQYEETTEGPGRAAEIGASHPWLTKRIRALYTFADARLYREHIGENGGESMDDIDEQVHGIIKVLQ